MDYGLQFGERKRRKKHINEYCFIFILTRNVHFVELYSLLLSMHEQSQLQQNDL